MMATMSLSDVTAAVSAFLFHEAKLLDDARIRDWHALYTDDCHYWVPIDETRPATECAAIINDNGLALEERIYHLLETTFAAQTPKSRTLHFITNVYIDGSADGDGIVVHSNQLIFELRTGDYRQVGLGELRPIPTSVTHELVRAGESFKIRSKTIRIIDRDMPQSNLTFLL